MVRARGQSGLLEARIVEGDQQVSSPGKRLSQPIIIQVTDETGARVSGALVSFRLPEDGITGTFRNGLKTDILKTDDKGRAAMRGLWAGGLAGQFQLRITVAEGEARAGTISTQFIAQAKNSGGSLHLGGWRPSRRALEIGAVILAAGAAGYAKTVASSSSNSARAAAAPPVIGAPTVTIGRP